MHVEYDALFPTRIETPNRGDCLTPFSRFIRTSESDNGAFACPETDRLIGLTGDPRRAMSRTPVAIKLGHQAKIERRMIRHFNRAYSRSLSMSKEAPASTSIVDVMTQWLRGIPVTRRTIKALSCHYPGFAAGISHALPTPELIRFLVPYSRILELGSGSGLVSHVLRSFGVDVEATDPWPWSTTALGDLGVRRLAAAEAVEEHNGGWSLMALWPNIVGENWLLPILRRATPGQVVLLASPELDFALQGGVTALHAHMDFAHGVGELMVELKTRFELISKTICTIDVPSRQQVSLRAFRRIVGRV